VARHAELDQDDKKKQAGFRVHVFSLSGFLGGMNGQAVASNDA
jgi:hypothetical protein